MKFHHNGSVDIEGEPQDLVPRFALAVARGGGHAAQANTRPETIESDEAYEMIRAVGYMAANVNHVHDRRAVETLVEMAQSQEAVSQHGETLLAAMGDALLARTAVADIRPVDQAA